MAFPVVMYGCEIWTIKKAEHQKLMLLNSGAREDSEHPLDSKKEPVNPKGSQSIIPLEGLMLKLKLQYFGHPTQRTDSLKKTLILGKIEGRSRCG